ncbi:choice-of-anchor J domain-containing protein [Tahibacter sp. UC22_41]|uniref:choice-of-anchor J domain-containing protein n=1 Tax=Tahibacter sp. UC22_41 TaxID=3350178 RepID=UPI0036DCA617
MRILHRRVTAAAVALAVSSGAFAAMLFSEDFQIRYDPVGDQNVVRCSGMSGPGTYLFPDGWLLRNVDNGVPAQQIDFVDEAWEVRDDYQLDKSNCVAFSTSYYNPAGTANDWMWTPPVTLPSGSPAVLTWRARSYDDVFLDGYQVRLMAAPAVPTGGPGVIGNQISASTVLFSTPGEASSWTSHNVDLGTYAGQTVRIGFVNNSNDKFLLVVDDIQVRTQAPDLAAVAAPGFAVDYSRVPVGIAVPVTLKVVGLNAGNVPLTTLTATAQIKRSGTAQGTPPTAPGIASLAPSGSTTFAFTPAPALAEPGNWTVRYTLSSDQNGSDAAPADNTLETSLLTRNSIEWARHEGGVSGVLGIGNFDGGELGTSFVLSQTATFEGVRFAMNSIVSPSHWPGQDVVANLRSADAVSGIPGAVIATTTSIRSTYAGGVYDVKFVGGARTLTPGRYFVGVVEPAGQDPMPLQMSRQRFLEATNWVYWAAIPGGAFRPVEDFGAQFRRVPNVSLLTEVPIFQNGFDPPPAAPTEVSFRERGGNGHSALAAPRE